MTRRVLPKAPPPKPVPVAPPPPPPPVAPPAPVAKPIEKAPAPAAPVQAKAAPVAHAAKQPAPVLKEVKKPVEAKKEHSKSEPTATYKMPPPTPLKTPAPRPTAKPAHAPSHAPAAAATATADSAKSQAEAAPAAARQKVRIPEVVTVKDLSEKLNVKPIEVIKKLLGLGTMVTINQQIDSDIATLAADAFGFDVDIIPILRETEAAEEKEDPAALKPRPPVVTIMGHV